MHLNEWSLREPAGRAARVAALELLDRVRETRERINDPADADALHDFRVSVRRLRSWMRAFDELLADTVARKTQKRLQRIADATGSSRDLEVHLEWVAERRKTLRGEQRRGADWLMEHLERRKLASDLELHQLVDAEFDRSTKRVEAAMSCYMTSVVDGEPPFAAVAARLVRRHASSLAKALKAVSTIGDRAEAHAARIAAKRLRYLLDPVDRAIPDVKPIVDELGELQDRLGELHDAQLFGSEIATAVSELLADLATGTATRGDHDDPVPGLLAFARRLHRSEEAAFAAARHAWLHDGAAPILGRVSAVADALDAIAIKGHETTRRYLLRQLPEMPAPLMLDIDIGYVAGDQVEERIRRERHADGTAQFYRMLKVGSGVDCVEVEEETTERVFTAMWPLTKGCRLRLHRHRIEDDDRVWNVDEFRDRELILGAIAVAAKEAAPALPEWIEAVLDRDVTDDESYGGRQLAR